MAKRSKRKPLDGSVVMGYLGLLDDTLGDKPTPDKGREKIRVQGPGIGLAGMRKMMRDSNEHPEK